MKKAILSGTLIAFAGVFAGHASAQCGLASANTGRAFALPQEPAQAMPVVREFETRGDDQRDSDTPIVGLWDVLFVQKGAIFDRGYDAFHSDGTEILNDGPVCLGVWAKTGARTYTLHHVFWNLAADGTINGKGTWDTTILMDKSGDSYTGSWIIKNFDLSGNPVFLPFSGTGTLTAKRITP